MCRIGWPGLAAGGLAAALLAGPASAGTAAAPAAPAWGILVAYVDFTNDYRFYGLSESNRQPAPQAGLHWLAPDNYYAGVFVSKVDFRDYRKTSVETDFYAGRHVLFGNNDLNLELLYGVYPDSAGHPSYLPPGAILPTYNFFELSGDLAHTFGALTLDGKAVWEPSLSRFKPASWSLNAAATYTISGWLKASAEAGHQWGVPAAGRAYWDIGLTASRGWQWAFDLRYYGTDSNRANCFHTNWCAPALVGKVTYTFQVL